MTRMIGLDFETYSDVNLPVHGLDQYVKSPHFQPLIAVIAWEDGTADLFDFVDDYTEYRLRLIECIGSNTIVAHNAGFEQAVLAQMGIDLPSNRFIDSAAVARAAGVAGKLEAAAPQLLGIDKLETGWDLIKLFSIPKEGQVEFDPQIVADNPDEWEEFFRYCMVDAELSLRIAKSQPLKLKELANNAVTMNMNVVGWNVDMKMVHNMHTRYLLNVKHAVEQFREQTGAKELNLNSHPQLIEWCEVRGVKATSFDEAHVARMLKAVTKKVASLPMGDKRASLVEVKLLLETKQIMGGSSLKKLATIIDTVGTDGRLHDQYLHCGAGATYRTTGRGVQMQNLKRLNGEGNDMLELFDETNQWSNDKLATNLRQVFTASHPDGFLIVGDFASVESRGLAWQADEQWKLDAYHQGEDLYKVQAGLIFGKHKSKVTKAERTVGKVGELACGYGAGGGAVKDFAAKMGVDMTEPEAAKLVRDWRGANPGIVEYWRLLDDGLHDTVENGNSSLVPLQQGYYVRIFRRLAPQSLRVQVKDEMLQSLEIRVVNPDHSTLFTRVIHGVHVHGRNIHYWKPSERKTGDLWTNFWVNPKTKRKQAFSVYGGKLSGLLTQSLCRELFFDSLRGVSNSETMMFSINVQIVGQFHDEIVLDWVPGPLSLNSAMALLEVHMTECRLPGFPLAAEIKHDYRYTK